MVSQTKDHWSNAQLKISDITDKSSLVKSSFKKVVSRTKAHKKGKQLKLKKGGITDKSLLVKSSF